MSGCISNICRGGPNGNRVGTSHERNQVQPTKETHLERQRPDRVPPGCMDLTDVYSVGAERYIVYFTNKSKE